MIFSKTTIPMLFAGGLLLASCSDIASDSQKVSDFKVTAESFADLQVLRYEVPGWNDLTLQQKEFAYYLYEAALWGRDIIYDQRGEHNIKVRKAIEAIWNTYKGDKSGENWEHFKIYSGRIWFSNGIYHHYANDKIMPEFSFQYFTELVNNSDPTQLPLEDNESIEGFLNEMKTVLFDPRYKAKMIDLSPNADNVAASANNFYKGVTHDEVNAFYADFPQSDHEPEWGLNSQLVKINGEIVEKVWKSGGMYGAALDKKIYWIEKAIPLAENEQQAQALRLLIEYYQTGDLKKWDDYSIAWTKNTETVVDFTDGFIEVYGDAIGKKGSYESIVSIRDFESSKRIAAIAKEAQWFEDNTPLMPQHKKKNVRGIDAKVINVVVEAGDAAPSTPIGINLPNSDWIRKEHGSKSVSLGNIKRAYNMNSEGGGFLEEFVGDEIVLQRVKKHGNLAADLHTDMHECIGHASGQLNPGVATPDKTLRNYASALEEARADLVSLYYIIDPKLIEIGVMESIEVGKAEYDTYMMNGLMTQLTRVKLGNDLQQAHMRNRALNAYWAYEKGKADNVVEFVKKDGKTYVQINNYEKLRELFGELLTEIQRIKSEGDYEAGKQLIENYAVKINYDLHKEVLERYAALNVKPYSGFIQPKLVPIIKDGKITNVKIEYPSSFFDQMLEYGKNYAILPTKN